MKITRVNSLANYIRKPFERSVDKRIVDSINIRNTRNIHAFSLIISIIDFITLIFFIASNQGIPGSQKTIVNVSICIAASVIVALLSGLIIRKYKSDGIISDTLTNMIISFFYIVMSIWGSMVDVAHYKNSEQMLTFYIGQFCFVCFITLLPKLGSLLITLSFLGLYFSIYQIDGAIAIQPQNYFIFVVIAVFGNAIRYMMMQESEKNKIDILELNEALQLEASIDDLTKLKNRKALREALDKYTGKAVYMIMADINYFKSFNDTYGHVLGDKVLTLVASATDKVFQDGDVYRYGGDEFLIVLIGHTEKEYKQKITEWEETVRLIRIKDMSIPITCSFGCEYSMIQSADDFRTAIKIADEKLYAVKKSRNNKKTSHD